MLSPMTPAQLRAFASIVRQGSVKGAAAELGLTDSAISMHVAQLRKELGDLLFERTGSGIAFTPGGLRLASRAVEILGLQDQTIAEVGQAAEGRRLLRLATSHLFAEHAAPGLIEQFTQRAQDLEVELSVHLPEEFAGLLATRTVDLAIGPAAAAVPEHVVGRPFLAFDLQVVAAPDHPYAGRQVTRDELRAATWYLGPSAIGIHGAIPATLAALGVPEERQRIFQNEAAALEEARRSEGLSPAVVFAANSDLTAQRIVRITGPGCTSRHVWAAYALTHDSMTATAELMHFLATPRAMQAMLRGSGVPIRRFRPSVYVTLWN